MIESKFGHDCLEVFCWSSLGSIASDLGVSAPRSFCQSTFAHEWRLDSLLAAQLFDCIFGLYPTNRRASGIAFPRRICIDLLVLAAEATMAALAC